MLRPLFAQARLDLKIQDPIRFSAGDIPAGGSVCRGIFAENLAPERFTLMDWARSRLGCCSARPRAEHCTTRATHLNLRQPQINDDGRR